MPLAACVIFLVYLCPELEYIRILDAELYRRAEIKSLEKQKELEENASKPEVKQYIIPREKPPRQVFPLIEYILPGFEYNKK